MNLGFIDRPSYTTMYLAREVRPNPTFLSAQELDSVIRKKRVLWVAFSRETVDFYAPKGNPGLFCKAKRCELPFALAYTSANVMSVAGAWAGTLGLLRRYLEWFLDPTRSPLYVLYSCH